MPAQWETMLFYLQNHPRWFEDSRRRAVGSQHLCVFRAAMPADWRLWRRGSWLIAEPPGGEPTAQGWKLHVCATSHNSVAVLERALPILRDAQVRFKFLADPDVVRIGNGKSFPRTASGKFITVYPADDAQFRRIAAELALALQEFTGPYILTDRRVPGSAVVYYRYGGFATVSQRRPDGAATLMIEKPDGTLVPDVRHPYWSPPEWVTDPFPQAAPTAEDDGTSLADGRFTVESAIAFSNRGGVYRGVDNETGADVILREARPFVQVGNEGIDATEILRHEYEILTALADTGLFVRPIAHFQQWEHAFLAEEYVEGGHLGRFTIVNNPLYDLNLTGDRLRGYYGRMRGIWRQVVQAIDAAHQRGILLNDLSLTNIMVTADDTVRIIDLESAFREGTAGGAGMVTPGLANRRALDTGRGDRRNDYYALGGIILCSIMAIHQTVVVDRSIARNLLGELAADLDLPPDLVSLIEELHDPEAVDVPDPDVLLKRLDALPFSSSWTRPVPLTLPATADSATRSALRERIGSTLTGVTDYFDGIADFVRTDRLFPADAMVFETNPLSVAHGAYGVLYAQHLIRGQASDKALGWALHHSTSNRAMPPGLYYGQAGVAWVLSAIGRPEAAAQILRTARDHELLWAESGVISGSAGYGMACLRLWRDTGHAEFLADARRVGERLASTAHRDQRGAWWLDTAGRIPIGYGYGGSGVAMFLLALHAATGDDAYLRLGRAALDFDLACCEWTDAGVPSFPGLAPTADAPTQVRRQYWDQGTAGVLTTLLRYHAVTGDPVLRGWIDDLLRDTRRKYVVFPQLFHGLSGIGNALLDAYEFLGDDALLAEAERTATGVLCFAVHRPEGVVFPGDQTVRESADLATGSAGAGLFLHRLLHARPGGRTNFNFVLDDLLDASGGTPR